MRIVKNILPEEQAIETVIKDALKYIADDSTIDGIEYHIGKADGKIFKLVIEPDHDGGFDSGVITEDSLAYQIVINT